MFLIILRRLVSFRAPCDSYVVDILLILPRNKLAFRDLTSNTKSILIPDHGIQISNTSTTISAEAYTLLISIRDSKVTFCKYLPDVILFPVASLAPCRYSRFQKACCE